MRSPEWTTNGSQYEPILTMVAPLKPLPVIVTTPPTRARAGENRAMRGFDGGASDTVVVAGVVVVVTVASSSRSRCRSWSSSSAAAAEVEAVVVVAAEAP